jgi:hypothetical protein
MRISLAAVTLLPPSARSGLASARSTCTARGTGSGAPFSGRKGSMSP